MAATVTSYDHTHLAKSKISKGFAKIFAKPSRVLHPDRLNTNMWRHVWGTESRRLM